LLFLEKYCLICFCFRSSCVGDVSAGPAEDYDIVAILMVYCRHLAVDKPGKDFTFIYFLNIVILNLTLVLIAMSRKSI